MNAVVAFLLYQAIAIVPAAPESRPVVLRVRDSSKVPVRGARIVVEPAVPAEMALAELLAKRAGAAKEDGLLDLGVGRSATGTLLGQLLAQCRDAFQDLGVFRVAGGVELLDNGSFLDGISEPHRQHTYSAAVVLDSVGQPPNLPHHVFARGQQADRLLQVQRAKRAQFAPYLHPKRACRTGSRRTNNDPTALLICHTQMLHS